MGENVTSKSSSRICKNNKKQRFNSLIKVLRPKVYITDSSNFKKLVQELTGNNASTGSPLPAYSQPTVNEQAPPEVLDFEIQGEQQESSMEASFDASIESLSSWNQVVLNEEINQSWNQIYEDVAAFHSSTNQRMELPAVWELESWLLDIDHEPFSFDNDLPQIEQDITSFPGHCESSKSLEHHLQNPILDSLSCMYNNNLYKF